LGTANGLLQYNGSDFTHWTKNDSLCSNWILSLHVTNTKLWIGTAEGLNCMDLESQRIIRVKNKLRTFDIEKEWITGIFEDHNNDIWIYNHGLIKFDNSKDTILHFKNDYGRLSNMITKVIVDYKDPNILWCGTADGLFKFDLIDNKFTGSYQFTHSNSKFAERINLIETDLYQDNNGKIYGAGLNGGMLIFDPSSKKVSCFDVTIDGISLRKTKFKQLVSFDENHILIFSEIGVLLYNITNNEIEKLY